MLQMIPKLFERESIDLLWNIFEDLFNSQEVSILKQHINFFFFASILSKRYPKSSGYGPFGAEHL